jgi:hypothetical protein
MGYLSVGDLYTNIADSIMNYLSCLSKPDNYDVTKCFHEVININLVQIKFYIYIELT